MSFEEEPFDINNALETILKECDIIKEKRPSFS
jgi:hypothetical protein